VRAKYEIRNLGAFGARGDHPEGRGFDILSDKIKRKFNGWKKMIAELGERRRYVHKADAGEQSGEEKNTIWVQDP